MNKYIIIVLSIAVIILVFFLWKIHKLNQTKHLVVFNSHSTFTDIVYAHAATTDQILDESQKQRYVAKLFKHYLIYSELADADYHRGLYKLDSSYQDFVDDPLGWKTTNAKLDKKLHWVKNKEIESLSKENFVILRLKGEDEKGRVRFYDILQVQEPLYNRCDHKHIYDSLIEHFKKAIKVQ